MSNAAHVKHLIFCLGINKVCLVVYSNDLGKKTPKNQLTLVFVTRREHQCSPGINI